MGRERSHNSDLTAERGCCLSTGPPTPSTKHNPTGSAKKDSSSSQLSDVPMESQIEELTTRCLLPSLPESLEMPKWRLHGQRDYVPVPVPGTQDFSLPRMMVLLGLAFVGRGGRWSTVPR